MTVYINYPILNDIPTLSSWEQNQAIEVTWTVTGYYSSYDYEYIFSDYESHLDTSLFTFYGVKGASYDLYSTSYYDPIELTLYDDFGHGLAVNSDYDYGEDSIHDFVAPYSGWYYVDASWDSGFWHDDVSLEIYEDLGTTYPVPSNTQPSYWSADREDALDIARLYNAAFDRLPDVGGLNYWVDQWEAGMSIRSISTEFYYSNEFSNTFGRLTDVEYIDLLYLNVLDRNADNAGLLYWVDQLQDGMARGEVLARFSDSIENVQNTEVMLSSLHYAGHGEWLL